MAAYKTKYYYTYPVKRKKRKPSGIGYVYFIRNRDSGRVKIGKTVNVESRLSELQVGNDSILDLVTFIPVPRETMHFWEQSIHDAVSEFRVLGEWFEVPDNVLQQTVNIYRTLVVRDI